MKPKPPISLPGLVLCLALTLAAPTLLSQPAGSGKPVPHPGLSISLWAREPMLKNPVALSFDDLGRLYVVETARRSTVDIDIRSHPDWIIEDLANQSVDDLRDFFRRRMAPELSKENASWLKDRNGDGSHDWRDLMTIKERVHRLEDTTGAGRADKATVFAEAFNEEITGVIAGVMPWNEDVFVTVYPDLWRLRDPGNSGKATSLESVFRGFGVHAGFDGHDLHGLTIGPDGKIYFSHGDNGFSVTNKEGVRLHHPNTGGVLRMNPDGSDLEVFAYGLRNPQEIAFDEFGNLFSVDNDGDLEDERERFVYITEGSDSGWRLHWQFRDAGWERRTHLPHYNPWTAERMWVPLFQGQPAHITPAITNYSVGPSGFKYNPGTAMGPAWERHFFLAQFPVQRITAFQTQPVGAGFAMTNEKTVLTGLMASSQNFGPDGALYVADWDGLWEPNERGAIWRLDDPVAAKNQSAIRAEVKTLLAQGMATRPVPELIHLLGHPDMRIRLRAQFELARRKETAVLVTLAHQAGAQLLPRIHALWALGQIRTGVTPAALVLADPEPELRAQSAKIAGDLHLTTAAPTLASLLSDPAPRVRFHAAIALGKTGAGQPVQAALVQALAENANLDGWLRHACVMGLSGLRDAPALATLKKHPSEAVRLAAVVALRRLHAPGAALFLRDTSTAVRREAARAIHDDDSIPEILPLLAGCLDDASPKDDEVIIRRAINASLRLGTPADARRLANFASHAGAPDALRAEALDALTAWDRSPYLDRVEGFHRSLTKRSADLPRDIVGQNLPSLEASAGPLLTRAIAEAIGTLGLQIQPTRLASRARDASSPSEVRVLFLQLLADAQPPSPLLASTLHALINDPNPTLRHRALEHLASVDAPAFVAAAGTIAPTNLVDRQLVLRLAGTSRSDVTRALLRDAMSDLAQDQLPAPLALDAIESAIASKVPALAQAASNHLAGLEKRGGFGRFQLALTGGDAVRGRDIFKTHVNAQCVRCHEAGGEGFQAGPVLTGVAARNTREYLLQSLIDPSAVIAPGFESISIETKDGEELDGIRVRESNGTLALRLGSGEVRELPASNISKRVNRSVSAMPPMGDILSLSEIRDLVAYLATLRQPAP